GNVIGKIRTMQHLIAAAQELRMLAGILEERQYDLLTLMSVPAMWELSVCLQSDCPDLSTPCSSAASTLWSAEASAGSSKTSADMMGPQLRDRLTCFPHTCWPYAVIPKRHSSQLNMTMQLYVHFWTGCIRLNPFVVKMS
ncbi:hypothetical protein GOODEAATRI_028157, partial [Goodea atripinnis]